MSSKSSHVNLYSASNEASPTLQVVSAAAKGSITSTSVLELKGTTVSLVNTSDSSKSVSDLATFLDGCSTTTALTAESTARASAIATEQSARSAAINAESAARSAAITAADNAQTTARNAQVATLTASVASEASSRSSADANLQSQIDTEKGRIDTLLAGSGVDLDTLVEIVAAFQNADSSIISTITQIQSDLTALSATVDTLTDSNP